MAAQDSVEDGMCSIYTALPSETTCSMDAELTREMNAHAVNDFSGVSTLPDLETLSVYTGPKSEVLVSMSDGFVPARLFDPTEYSMPPSEIDVTMGEAISPMNQDMSIYSIPPSEVNVTMNGKSPVMGEADPLSSYAAPQSEVDVTMRDAFTSCKIMKKLGQLEYAHATEYSAISQLWDSESETAISSDFDDSAFEYVQKQLGISDDYVFGLQRSDGSHAKVIDSIECLKKLSEFEPRPVELDGLAPTVHNMNMERPSAKPSSSSSPSVESYLLKSSNVNSVHHEI